MDGRKLYIILVIFQLFLVKNFRILFQKLLVNNPVYFLRKILRTVGGNHLASVQKHHIHPIWNIRQMFPRIEVQQKIHFILIFRKISEKRHQNFFCATVTQRTDSDKDFFLQLLILKFHNSSSPGIANPKSHYHYSGTCTNFSLLRCKL